MKDLVPEEIVYRQRIVRLDHNNHHPVGFVYRLADRTIVRTLTCVTCT